MPRSRISLPIVALGRPQSARSAEKNANTKENLRDWFRLEAAGGADTTHVYIYDVIGGWFGVYASELIDQIKAVKTPTITVHINSPGGDAFDSVAIYNALLAHPANIDVQVDALAASGASIIAQAGDTVTMNRGSMMMIHDAIAGTYGNASDMRVTADILDKLSNSIASIYAARTGDTEQVWRDVMIAEAWYTAQEAVDAGLADKVGAQEASDNPSNLFDLSPFNYAGRAAAPSPAALMSQIANKEARVGAKNEADDKKVEEPQGQNPVGVPPAEDEDDDSTPVEDGTVSDEPGEGTTSGEQGSNPQNKATGFSVKIDGAVVSDPRKVQAHIDLLEGFRNDTKKAARTSFVESLAADNKVPASNIERLQNYAATLSDDGFDNWAKTWDDAPAHQGLAKNVAGGVTNPDGDDTPKDAVEQKLETAAGIVDQHKKARMPQAQLEKTPSYQLLKAHNRI
jgi:ATP-dependent protease ClpP protease subunit